MQVDWSVCSGVRLGADSGGNGLAGRDEPDDHGSWIVNYGTGLYFLVTLAISTN